MREIVPGIFHWRTYHPTLDADVSSYYVEPAGVVLDPRTPEEGMAAFDGRTPPQQIVATSGHHLRHAEEFAKFFDIPIRVPSEAAENVRRRPRVAPYDAHDELIPGMVTAIHIDVLAADEYAIHFAVSGGVLAVADAILHYGDALAFPRDELLGAHPQRVKDGVKNRFRAQLERHFDTLLFAHGDPIAHDAKTALREFVKSPVGYPEFGQAL
jgi:hypothetical protein